MKERPISMAPRPIELPKDDSFQDPLDRDRFILEPHQQIDWLAKDHLTPDWKLAYLAEEKDRRAVAAYTKNASMCAVKFEKWMNSSKWDWDKDKGWYQRPLTEDEKRKIMLNAQRTISYYVTLPKMIMLMNVNSPKNPLVYKMLDVTMKEHAAQEQDEESKGMLARTFAKLTGKVKSKDDDNDD